MALVAVVPVLLAGCAPSGETNPCGDAPFELRADANWAWVTDVGSVSDERDPDNDRTVIVEVSGEALRGPPLPPMIEAFGPDGRALDQAAGDEDLLLSWEAMPGGAPHLERAFSFRGDQLSVVRDCEGGTRARIAQGWAEAVTGEPGHEREVLVEYAELGDGSRLADHFRSEAEADLEAARLQPTSLSQLTAEEKPGLVPVTIEYHVPLAWEDSGDAVGTKLADGWNDGVSLAIAAGDLVALAGDVRPGAPLELWLRSGESTLVVARLDIPADVKPGATVNAEFDGTAAEDELPSDLSDVDPASFGASLRMAS